MTGIISGPWIVRTTDGRKNIRIESAEVVNADNEILVATLHITAWKHGGRNAFPTAHLISAAPDLYEALKNIENDDGRIPAPIWKMRNDAIAKAEGIER